jgi:hypothetical protein
MGVQPCLLFSLGGHSKQAGDEGDLLGAVSLSHAVHLPFPHHVHDLISLQGSPRRLEGKEAHPWFGQSFDKAVVLLHHVIEIFDQALVLHTREAFRWL